MPCSYHALHDVKLVRLKAIEFDSVLISFSQDTGVTSGGASDTKNILMTECMAYGMHQAGGRGDIPVSQCVAYGEFEEGQQMREGENDAYEIVDGSYYSIPN